MTRSLWLAGVLAVAGATAAACSDTDDRPRTLEYVTEAILKPSCAEAECHSTFTQEHGDIFDTVSAARRSMVNNFLVASPDPASDELVNVITKGYFDPDDKQYYRMPYDSPLPDNDLVLIEDWIRDGGGNGPEGAQCLSGPNDDSPMGCNTNGQLVTCVDGNITGLVQDCTHLGSNGGSCVEGACVAN